MLQQPNRVEALPLIHLQQSAPHHFLQQPIKIRTIIISCRLLKLGAYSQFPPTRCRKKKHKHLKMMALFRAHCICILFQVFNLKKFMKDTFRVDGIRIKVTFIATKVCKTCTSIAYSNSAKKLKRHGNPYRISFGGTTNKPQRTH